jgi:hypothetical protein
VEFEVPKIDMLDGQHFPLIWSNGFCGGRGKRGALLKEKQASMAKKMFLFIYF